MRGSKAAAGPILPGGEEEGGEALEFVHPPLNEGIAFCGGEYRFLEEGTLTHRGREVLYLLGAAAVESSCCGPGGCAFIKVPGYLRSWKTGRNPEGRPVSQVEGIEDPDGRREIEEQLKGKHPGFGRVEFL